MTDTGKYDYKLKHACAYDKRTLELDPHYTYHRWEVISKIGKEFMWATTPKAIHDFYKRCKPEAGDPFLLPTKEIRHGRI